MFDLGSLYDRFEHLRDPRNAKGKRYSLVTLLVVIFLAKLCGQDTPVEIADWARNQAGELVRLLKLKRTWMPHHNTVRRVFHNILDEAEFDRMASEYNQQKQGKEGDVWSLDGKNLRGTRVAGAEQADHILSVYDGQQQRVKAQFAVKSKENEIVAAPKALEQLDIRGKLLTGDPARHFGPDFGCRGRLSVGGEGEPGASVSGY